jgi:hypothetical protein
MAGRDTAGRCDGAAAQYQEGDVMPCRVIIRETGLAT